MEIIKVVDNSCKPAKIVGFASWKIRRSEKETRKPESPKGADPRFLNDFWDKAGPLVERLFNADTDIGLWKLPAWNRADVWKNWTSCEYCQNTKDEVWEDFW